MLLSEKLSAGDLYRASLLNQWVFVLHCAKALIFTFVSVDLGALFKPAWSPIPLLVVLPQGWTYSVSVGNSMIMKKMCL